MPDGVDRSDPQGVADRRVRRRAATLRHDAVDAAELHEVEDDEEVPGEAEVFDDAQLVVDLRVGAGEAFGVARPVPLERPTGDELPQPRGLGVAGGHRIGRQVRGDELEVEHALGRERRRRGHRLGVAPVPGEHLGGGAQVSGGRGGQPAVHVVEGGPGADGRQGGGEVGVPGGRVVGVRRRDEGQVRGPREVDEEVVALAVEGVAGVRELDGDVVAAEGRDEPVELGARRSRVPGCSPAAQRLSDGALAAAGEDEPLPGGLLTEALEGVVGCPLVSGRQVRGGDRAREVAVALRSACQDEQVRGAGVGHAGGCVEHTVRARQVELGAEDGGQPDLAGRLGEAHHAVQPVVVGDGERGEPEAHGLGSHLLGVVRTVEEAEGGVCVELRVGRALSHRAPRRSTGRRCTRAAARSRRRARPGGRPGAGAPPSTSVPRRATGPPSRRRGASRPR